MIAYLVRIAAKLHVPYDECEDMAQEALLHAFEHSEQFHGHTLEELRSWLVAIVRNLVMDAFRYRGRHPIQSLNAAAVDPVDEKEANRADMAEWSECLVPWLARLKREDPESYRLICARYLEERTIPELMDETGLKARAISDHTYRALERVRSWASRFGFDGEEVI